MDAVGFDRLTRWVGDASSRRTILGIALGSTLGGWLGLAETEGKKRRKRKRKRKNKNRKKKGCNRPVRRVRAMPEREAQGEMPAELGQCLRQRRHL